MIPGVLGFSCGIASIFQYEDILGGYQSQIIFQYRCNTTGKGHEYCVDPFMACAIIASHYELQTKEISCQTEIVTTGEQAT